MQDVWENNCQIHQDNYKVKKDLINKNSICDNFLESRCRYPQDTERTNPCLKNHAVGLVLENKHKLKIIIGPYDSLKYRIVWNGGLLGIILGYLNRTLNLDVLNSLLKNIHSEIVLLTKGFIEQGCKRQKIEVISDFFGNVHIEDKNNIAIWLLLATLQYYSNYEIRQFINEYFLTPIEYLKRVIKGITDKVQFNILNFLELYRCYPPIEPNLRRLVEDKIKEIMQIKDMKEFTRERFNKLNISIDCLLKEVIDLSPLNFNNLFDGIEIYEIYCSFGSYLIVRANISVAPIILDMRDIIGRKVL